MIGTIQVSLFLLDIFKFAFSWQREKVYTLKCIYCKATCIMHVHRFKVWPLFRVASFVIQTGSYYNVRTNVGL